MGDIKYRPHQIIPINYLTKKENRGLIINHYMGSGKTLLGLGFADKMKHKDIIIISPDSIKFVWHSEIKEFGFKLPSVKILGFSDIFDLLQIDNMKKCVVIIDEAHNLINIIKDPTNSSKSKKLIKKLQDAHKVMCLTGTPMYNQEHDLAYLVNIVAGSDIMSYSDFRWKRQYYKKNNNKTNIYGYLLILFYVLKQVDLYTLKQLGPVIEILIVPFFQLVFGFIGGLQSKTNSINYQ